ncbi:MAG: hypothetical protein ACJ74T_09030 [Pyrinomonadaceae bacterium]
MSAREEPESKAQRDSEEDKSRRPDGHPLDGSEETPLFLRDSSDGWKGNPQDEKDEIGE